MTADKRNKLALVLWGIVVVIGSVVMAVSFPDLFALMLQLLWQVFLASTLLGLLIAIWRFIARGRNQRGH